MTSSNEDVIVNQIVQLIKPLRIIVFGSSARGVAGPHSDLDLLIVVPDGSHRRQIAQLLYRSVKRHGKPVDFVVVTENDLTTHKDHFWTVIHPALREGRVVYAA